MPPRQLSLFDDAVQAPPAPTAAAAPPPRRQPVQAQAVPPADEPANAPVQSGLQPATAAAIEPLTAITSGHLQAERAICLGEHSIAYALRRARRRTIGFTVGADGLTVSAPRWVGVADVEKALHAKAGWILRKLHEQRERARRLSQARVDWRDGVSIPFLGRSIAVRLDPLTRGALFHADSAALHIGLPPGAAPAQIRDTVQSWLQRQARRIFEERCAAFAPRLDVRVKRMALSSATTRWGSASADGSVRLNWRLVHFALPVIDYVVAHELAHLREMNHSAAFWGVVRSVLPDYEHARGALRSEVLPVFD